MCVCMCDLSMTVGISACIIAVNDHKYTLLDTLSNAALPPDAHGADTALQPSAGLLLARLESRGLDLVLCDTSG